MLRKVKTTSQRGRAFEEGHLPKALVVGIHDASQLILAKDSRKIMLVVMVVVVFAVKGDVGKGQDGEEAQQKQKRNHFPSHIRHPRA